MGLFDFFKKRKETPAQTTPTNEPVKTPVESVQPSTEPATQPSVEPTPLPQVEQPIAQPLPNMDASRNFIDDLIAYCDSRDNITAAYLGRIHNTKTNTDDWFLGVEHTGDLQQIQGITYTIKQTLLPQVTMNFVSNEHYPEYLDFIKQHNFPFYVKGATNPIHVATIKYWLGIIADKKEVFQIIKQKNVFALVQMENSTVENQDSTLRFPSYKNPTTQRDFIPVFTEVDAITNRGAMEIPPALTVIEIDLGQAIGDQWDNQYIILNPGMPLAIEFNA